MFQHNAFLSSSSLLLLFLFLCLRVTAKRRGEIKKIFLVNHPPHFHVSLRIEPALQVLPEALRSSAHFCFVAVVRSPKHDDFFVPSLRAWGGESLLFVILGFFIVAF